MVRVKEHSEEWAVGQGLIITEAQMIKNLQAENILLQKKLDYYLIKCRELMEAKAENAKLKQRNKDLVTENKLLRLSINDHQRTIDALKENDNGTT